MILEPYLVRAAERFLGVVVQSSGRLAGGDEAIVLLVETDGGEFVLHASPAWRTRAELECSHCVARHANQLVSQVVAPVRRGGRTVFECRGRFVAVFPFIDGQMLDREDRVLRYEAAVSLAAIHNALIDLRGGRPTPPHDPALDAWWLSVQDRTFLVSATHGDYYRRNLHCANSQIVGVIDWHDGPPARVLRMEAEERDRKMRVTWGDGSRGSSSLSSVATNSPADLQYLETPYIF